MTICARCIRSSSSGTASRKASSIYRSRAEVADRDFAYPERPAPNVIAFTQSRPLIANPYAETGVKVVTIADLRWKRRDIKSTSMLAQAMGKQAPS